MVGTPVTRVCAHCHTWYKNMSGIRCTAKQTSDKARRKEMISSIAGSAWAQAAGPRVKGSSNAMGHEPRRDEVRGEPTKPRELSYNTLLLDCVFNGNPVPT